MSPAAAFHTQLASIMEVLANTAVAEICELVDSGYSVMQLEISRSRKENEVLRRKLRLMELRAARATALRVAATGGSTALLLGGRSRAQQPGHEPRRSVTPRGLAALSRVSNQQALQGGDTGPSADSGNDSIKVTPAERESVKLTTEVIKVEDDDDDESWSQSEQDQEFCHISDGQTTETEAPPPLNRQEVADEGGDSTQTWVSEEVNSTSMPVQKTLNTSHKSESSGYDHLMYETHLQHGSISTQNPLSEEPGCSYVLNSSVSVTADSGCSTFPFTVCEVTQSAAETQQPAGFQSNQQRAPLPIDEPQLPVSKELTERQNAFIRRDRWRHQGGFNKTFSHSQGDGGPKTFSCNYCGKTLACLKNLKTHMRVHTGEKPFVCPLCGKRFSDSSNLKRHQSVHTGEKRYSCVHCGKRFAQSGSLKVHMTVHSDCKQFMCSFCSKTFISSSHLRRHLTLHTGEKQLT